MQRNERVELAAASLVMPTERELEACQARIAALEKENLELRQEVSRLRSQVNTLKAHDIDRKSMLWKKLQTSMDSNITEKSPQKPVEKPEYNPKLGQKDKKDVAKPSPPPPPPPLPTKLLAGTKSLRRVPEVMEFYRSLMKRDAQKETRASAAANHPIQPPRNMIGEIENRSTYHLNIKSDVEKQGELVNFLSKQIQAKAFTDISEVEPFVKWLDGELSCLVDERAVLKHFPQWPERKADALREAACSYREIKNLELEVLSYKETTKLQISESLKKMQALQDRLEKSVNGIERVRDGTSKKYRELHIPWSWLMETGVTGKLKFASVNLGKQYMQRISKELESRDCAQEGELLMQGARFAHRVHQFAGGFDSDTLSAFEELKRIGTSLKNT